MDMLCIFCDYSYARYTLWDNGYDVYFLCDYKYAGYILCHDVYTL